MGWRDDWRDSDERDNGNDFVPIDEVTVIGESEKALRITHAFLNEPVWIAKSHCDLDVSTAVKPGDIGTLVMKKWVASEKELI